MAAHSAAGDLAVSDSLKSALGTWEALLSLIAPVTFSFLVLVAQGSFPGDVWHHLLAVLHVWIASATALAGRCGVITRQSEFDAGMVAITSLCITLPSYVCLCPWTAEADLVVMVVGMPMVILLLVCLNVFCHSEGFSKLVTRSEHVACIVLSLAAFTRCIYDVQARQTLALLILLLPGTIAVARFMRSLYGSLLEAQSTREAAFRSLADSQDALARVLNSLCNVVMRVDEDFRLQNPTWQVYDLLMGGKAGEPSDLHGCSLFDFMASDAEVAKLRSFLSGMRQQGPASIFSVEMKDFQGTCFAVQFHHTCTVSDGNGPVHLLGARLECDPAVQREPPPMSDRYSGMPWQRAGEASSAAPACLQDLIAGLQKTASILSEPHAEVVSGEDASCVAVRFDAGTKAFDVTRGSLLTGPLRRRRVGLLSLLGQVDARMLERWVHDETYEQEMATRNGQPVQPTPFPGSPAFKLPATKPQQILQPGRMWLQIHEETDLEDIPMTLWLTCIKMLTRSQALEVLQEEDVDAASDSSEDLASEASSL